MRYMAIILAVILSGCESPDKRQSVEKQTVYENQVPGVKLPFTDITIGGVYSESEILVPDQQSKKIVKQISLKWLLAAAGIFALLAAVGIFWAIYCQDRRGVPFALVWGIMAILSISLAYYFDVMMWILGAVLILALIYIVYLAFAGQYLQAVIDDLVETGETMKRADWTPETKSKIFKQQGLGTVKEVRLSKARLNRKTTRTTKNIEKTTEGQ